VQDIGGPVTSPQPAAGGGLDRAADHAPAGRTPTPLEDPSTPPGHVAIVVLASCVAPVTALLALALGLSWPVVVVLVMTAPTLVAVLFAAGVVVRDRRRTEPAIDLTREPVDPARSELPENPYPRDSSPDRTYASGSHGRGGGPTL
jgi:hypothetical protein